MDVAKNKKIIHVVGGGFNQVAIVKKAKALGLQVLVTDFNENPPCRSFADYYEQIDTTNREATLIASKKHKIDYVVTDQTDVAVPTVAYIAEELGLKGIGYNTALKFTNKHMMRKALESTLAEHIPESYYFDKLSAAEDFAKGLSEISDYLVKPINSQGSKAVTVLDHNYKEKIFAALKESRDRGIIIEKFIAGFEFSVEAFVKDSGVYNLTLTKKYHYANNPCLDERNTFLGDIDLDLERRIFELNTKIIKTLGLTFGNTHAEYKVNNGKIYLIEIAARGCGGCIASHIIPYLTDFDPIEALLKTLIDEPFEIKINDYKKKFAVLKFFKFSPGKVKNIYIDDEVYKQSAVFNFGLVEGDTISDAKDSSNRPGFFIVWGTDRENVLLKEKLVEALVRVEYAETGKAYQHI